MSKESLDFNVSKHCAKCSANVKDITASVNHCSKCAQEGYTPPFVSANRNLSMCEHIQNNRILSNNDDGYSYLSQTAATCNQYDDETKNDKNNSDFDSFNSQSNQFMNVDTITSRSCQSSQDGAVDGSASLASIDLETSSTPTRLMTHGASATKKLWNQIDALRRDENIVVQCELNKEKSEEANCQIDNENVISKQLEFDSHVLEHQQCITEKIVICSEETDIDSRVSKEMSLTKAASRAHKAANRLIKQTPSEIKGLEEDNDIDRYSILTREKMGLRHGKRSSDSVVSKAKTNGSTGCDRCWRWITWTLVFLLIVLLLVCLFDVRTYFGHGLRYLGLCVDWKLRHVGDSPPI